MGDLGRRVTRKAANGAAGFVADVSVADSRSARCLLMIDVSERGERNGIQGLVVISKTKPVAPSNRYECYVIHDESVRWSEENEQAAEART